MKVAFLDRDGTLLWEPEDTKQIDSLERLRILDGVMDGLRRLQESGFSLVLVSNQNGIGRPEFPVESFEIPQAEFLRLLRERGVIFHKVFVCPHLPADNCDCRKPKTGLVRDFLRDRSINLAESLMIGDRDTDRQFALNIGVRFIPMQTNGAFPILEPL